MTLTAQHWVPVEEVQPLVRMLVARYGSVHEAGRVYDERYGYKGGYKPNRRGGQCWHGTGARVFNRILSGGVQVVRHRTYDQIETLEAS